MTDSIMIELAADSELASMLRECADEELRTPEAQAVWMLRVALRQWQSLYARRGSAPARE